jgi:hypothetical protein
LPGPEIEPLLPCGPVEQAHSIARGDVEPVAALAAGELASLPDPVTRRCRADDPGSAVHGRRGRGVRLSLDGAMQQGIGQAVRFVDEQFLLGLSGKRGCAADRAANLLRQPNTV